MKIAISSDHKGYRLKTTLITYLMKKGYELIDLGTDSVFSTDYPKYAFSLCLIVPFVTFFIFFFSFIFLNL